MKRAHDWRIRLALITSLLFISLFVMTRSAQAQGIVRSDGVPAGTTLDSDAFLTGDNIVIDGTVLGDVLAISNKREALEGFLIPRSDAHRGENVAPRDERLAWLTGFTGSAGLAIVLPESAAIFVDGRYTLQVRQQVDAGLYTFRHVTDEPPGKNQHLRGVFRRRHTADEDSCSETRSAGAHSLALNLLPHLPMARLRDRLESPADLGERCRPSSAAPA